MANVAGGGGGGGGGGESESMENHRGQAGKAVGKT